MFFVEAGYELLRCEECGLLYVDEPPPPPALKGMYDHEQWLSAEGEVARDDRSYARNELLLQVARDGLDFISASVGELSGSLLDLGCGDGQMLLAAAERGLSAEGVELSAARVARGRAAGLAIHEGDAASFDARGRVYDIVTCRDILSHLPEPMALMRTARRLLKPGGVLFLQTGNKAELIDKRDGEALLDFWGVPGHLVFFGEPQLRRALGECGMEVAGVRRTQYLDWQLSPQLLRQREGRFRGLRYVLGWTPPVRIAAGGLYRRWWHRGRPEAAALWMTARAG